MVTATICTIGDEILIGQIIDTNSAMIAKELNLIGVKVNSMISCSDEKDDIITTLSNALKRSEIVIVTGGLGPTADDITKGALAQLSQSRKFVENKTQLAIIKKLMKARGIAMLNVNKLQASVPEKATVIPNRVGTAPILQFEFSKSQFGRKNLLFSMPGVPFETQNALPQVISSIRKHYKLSDIIHHTICTFGIPESTLTKTIAKWESALDKNIHLAYLPNPILGVRLRLSIYGVCKDEGKRIIKKSIASLKKILGDNIYGEGDISPVEVVGKLLLSKKATISTAESCTGGLIAHLFTLVPGASQYFWGSAVCYDNSVKQKVLGVKQSTLESVGAVSKECVEEMARGARKKLGTTYSIATSGIAGPSGGTPDKPVGTVWIGVSGPKGTKSICLGSKSTREINIKRFAASAIDFFRKSLINNEI